MMSMLRIRVLAFEDGDGWIAQVIDHDICVRSESLLKLPKVLAREIAANIHVNRRLGMLGLDGIAPAPEHFRTAFEAATNRFIPEDAGANSSGVATLEFKLVEPLAA
jgi:hypothetical protein